MNDYRNTKRFRDHALISRGFDERLRQRRHRQHVAAVISAAHPTLAQVADAECLLAVNWHRKTHGGRAAGPDRVVDADLGAREEAGIYRAVAAELIAGVFKPSTRRTIRLPKPKGGFREISVRSIVCRTVSAAVAMLLTPVLERVFLSTSHGFRAGRGPWSLLLHLERLVAQEGRFVIAQDDIAKAFDNMPIRATVAALRHHVADAALVALIETILRGGSPNNQRAIDQGSALSPLALNALLHSALDEPFSQNAALPPLLRYADDLVFVGRDVSEGLAAIDQAKQLLEPHGLTLKGNAGNPVDLRDSPAQILGYALKWEGRIQCSLPDDAWKQLGEKLAEGHRHANPVKAAEMAAKGWLQHAGPTLEEESVSVIDRIMATAQQTGFRELPRESVMRAVQSSQDSWRAYRAKWSGLF